MGIFIFSCKGTYMACVRVLGAEIALFWDSTF